MFSVEDDMRDPKTREELLRKPKLVELSPEEAREVMRRSFD